MSVVTNDEIAASDNAADQGCERHRKPTKRGAFLELLIAQLMEQQSQGHQFRQDERGWTPPLLASSGQQTFLPFQFEALAKIIDQAK